MPADRIPPYRRLTALAIALWTLGGLLSLGWNLRNHHRSLEELARTTARSNYEKEVAFRSWSTAMGGVYVPVTAGIAPNPYLAALPERDVVTTEGKVLTLLNPAYINRQVHEIQRRRTGLRSHLTSLHPLRAQNAPDKWEKTALERIGKGEKEVSGRQVMDGMEFMRLMRPIVIEEPCLKCHKEEGLKVGEPAGGLSVSVPMSPVRAAAAGSLFSIWSWHLITWLLGLSGIVLYSAKLESYGRRQVQSENRIRRALEEKEVLLREVHHRVKNNLQVVSGILELQSSIIRDQGSLNALRVARNRIQTMALIHERLYRSGDLARIDLAEYLASLSKELYKSYGVDTKRIPMSLALQPVTVDVETAILCGLIANELLVNAMKYAFPEGLSGSDQGAGISVSLEATEHGFLRLMVSDSGVGLPEVFDLESLQSMGLRLVDSLLKQMGGRLEVSSASGGKGAAFIVHLPLPPSSGKETA